MVEAVKKTLLGLQIAVGSALVISFFFWAVWALDIRNIQ
jgi:hypothetical protein